MDVMSGSSGDLVRRVDELQRRRRVIGFSFAVAKRYGEDHGGWLGSLIAYYGFFSLYPLLVVFVTIATWMFKDRPEALQRVLEALRSKLPFVTASSAPRLNSRFGISRARVGCSRCRCS